jgi:hypothetical protein
MNRSARQVLLERFPATLQALGCSADFASPAVNRNTWSFIFSNSPIARRFRSD